MDRDRALKNPAYDNWKLQCPDEPLIVGNCIECGAEIYDGEPVFELPEGLIHRYKPDGHECFVDYAMRELSAKKTYAEVNILGHVDNL